MSRSYWRTIISAREDLTQAELPRHPLTGPKGGKRQLTLDNTILNSRVPSNCTVCRFHHRLATMKCPHYDTTRTSSMDHMKSPVKDPIKPQCPPPAMTTVSFSLNNDTRPVTNKENSTERELDRNLDDALEDSGYLSLHNSQIDEHHGHEDNEHSLVKHRATVLLATAQSRTISPGNSPSKFNAGCRVSAVAASTPVEHPRRRRLSFTPAVDHSDPNLPILKFQREVCEKLAKSYQKNKKYDWSIVSKVAEDHLLDRVIGGHMGLEFVDMFASLLSRNMKSILGNILALLGDMDLISCRKVSRTWRKIILEDTAAMDRCQQAKEVLRESVSSLRQKDCGLTRDLAVSRVVLSCMQTRASASRSSPSVSSSSSCKVTRCSLPPQEGHIPNSQCTRFKDFVEAANKLKQHESLRSCKLCGSPATHSPEIQRATCTRDNCLFDFCTCCQEGFHGSTPCRKVGPRHNFSSSKSTKILPGSARSKRNVRRL